MTTTDSCVSSDIKILTSDIMNPFLLVSLSKGKVWKLTTELNLEDVSHNGTAISGDLRINKMYLFFYLNFRTKNTLRIKSKYYENTVKILLE